MGEAARAGTQMEVEAEILGSAELAVDARGSSLARPRALCRRIEHRQETLLD
jgi:hypothetical protein